MLHVVGPSIISAALASCTPAPPSVGHRRPVGRQADGVRERFSSSFPSSPPGSYFFLPRTYGLYGAFRASAQPVWPPAGRRLSRPGRRLSRPPAQPVRPPAESRADRWLSRSSRQPSSSSAVQGASRKLRYCARLHIVQKWGTKSHTLGQYLALHAGQT